VTATPGEAIDPDSLMDVLSVPLAVGAILTATAGAPPTTVAKTYDLDETATASDGTDVFTFGDVKDGKADVLRVGGNGKAARVTSTGARAVRTVLAVNATQVFWIQDETS
jgi:hypothetical protein